MATTPLAFPVPGENFTDRTGVVRGVTKVEVGSDGTIQVGYLEGAPEYYYTSAKLTECVCRADGNHDECPIHPS